MAVEESRTVPEYVKRLDYNPPANELPKLTEMPHTLEEVEALMTKARKAGQYDAVHAILGAGNNIRNTTDPETFQELRGMPHIVKKGKEALDSIDEMEREAQIT